MASHPPRRQRYLAISPEHQHSRDRGREDEGRRRSREGSQRRRSRDGGSNKRQRSNSQSKDRGYGERRDRPYDSVYQSFERKRSRSRDYREERRHKRDDSPERHKYRNFRQPPPHPSKTRRDSTSPRRRENESKARRDIEKDTGMPSSSRTQLRDDRSKNPPKESSAFAKPMGLLSNSKFPGTECGNCQDPEHRLHVCVWPVDEYGFVMGCPRCNTTAHMYSKCPVPTGYKYYEDDWYYLIHARNNKPPIWTDIDLRALTRKEGSDFTEFPWTYAFSMKQDGLGFLRGYQTSAWTLRDPAWLAPHDVPVQVHPTKVEAVYLKMKAEVAKAKQEIQQEVERRGLKRELEEDMTSNKRQKQGKGEVEG
jgi:hypothetical protein